MSQHQNLAYCWSGFPPLPQQKFGTHMVASLLLPQDTYLSAALPPFRRDYLPHAVDRRLVAARRLALDEAAQEMNHFALLRAQRMQQCFHVRERRGCIGS